MGIEKFFFQNYNDFLQESPASTEITGTVDYYGYYRFQDGDEALTTAQIENLDRWTILRVTTSGNVKTYEWAAGQWNNFSHSWTGRATHTYTLRKWQ